MGLLSSEYGTYECGTYSHPCMCIHTHFRRSCSLVDTLLALSEQGHYEEVMSIFASPFKNCPELVFLAAIKAKVLHSSASMVVFAKVLGYSYRCIVPSL